MFCKNCGSSLNENATYCGNCGARVAESPITAGASKSHKGLIAIIIALIILLIGVCTCIILLMNQRKEERTDTSKVVEASEENEEEKSEKDSSPKDNSEEDTEDDSEDDSSVASTKDVEEDSDTDTQLPKTDEQDIEQEISDENTDEEETTIASGEPKEAFNPLEETLLSADASLYEKSSTYKTEMNVSNMVVEDYQVLMANGDVTTIMWEITCIDLSAYSESEKTAIAKTYSATYKGFEDRAIEGVEIAHGLYGDYYRFEMLIDLEASDMTELIDNGFINLTAGDKDALLYISYQQTCDSMGTLGYTLVE